MDKPFDRLQATLALDAPVSSVRLVSPKRAVALGKMGIASVRDLISNYPRRYIDMSEVRTIAQARIGESCTIKAHVHEVKVKKPRPQLMLAEVTLLDSTGTLIVTAFRQPWLADQLKPGVTVAVSGKVEFNYGFKRMTNPFIEQLEGDGAGFGGMVVPVHPLTGAIKGGMMRRLIFNALQQTRGILDPLPLSLRVKYKLMSRQNAFHCIHFPQSMAQQLEARRRLAYEEVLLLELMLMRESAKRSERRTAVAHVVDGPCVTALADALPFTLTAEQVQARDEVLGKMAAPDVMNHMLLGDVGTGKTIVAAFALAAAADSSNQALLMAPTEVLAQQHASSLGPLLQRAGVSWDLLTGATEPSKRTEILKRVREGATSVLIGTHALLEKDVLLARCSLAIIDEQQRFGVEQRHALLEKGACPDALYLTATPIPRTLALALFGNLSLSYLTIRPHATVKRTTCLHTRDEQGVAYDAAKQALLRGEQVYVVCPLVGQARPKQAAAQSPGADAEDAYEFASIAIEDERDMAKTNVAAAEERAKFLQAKVFTKWEVGLLHGKLPQANKQAVMQEFREGRIDVLVATTVIEVGVDVPNATVMIVEDADRFGLSQLHQLRGRVGRGEKPAEVHLVSGTKSERALERLAYMEKTDDGFELASYDLSLRREGDILGNRQHGASLLKLVNVMRDKGLVEAAHADALAIMREDPDLTSELYRPLAREASVVYNAANAAQAQAGG